MASVYIDQLIETIESLLIRQQFNLWEITEFDCLLREHISDLRLNLHASFDEDNKTIRSLFNNTLNLPELTNVKRRDALNVIERIMINQDIYLYGLIESKTELQHQIDELKQNDKPNEHIEKIDGSEPMASNDLNVLIKLENVNTSTYSVDTVSSNNCKNPRQPKNIARQNKNISVPLTNSKFEDNTDDTKNQLTDKNHRKFPKGHNLHCSICKMEFDRHLDVKVHSKICGADGKCPYCSKEHTNRTILANHIRRIHMSEAPEKHKCTLCHKGFRTRGQRRLHLLNVHSAKWPHPCTQCSKSFKSNQLLDDHLNRHTGAKPYTCDICHLTFAAKYLIVDHMMVHSGWQPFLCNVCGMRLNSKSALQNHIETHSDIKQFQCTKCDQSFAQRRKLNLHMHIHFPRNFACTQSECDKKFYTKSALQKHMKIHSCTKRFACNLCDYKSYTNYQVTAHKRNAHGPKKTMQCIECHRWFSSVAGLQLHVLKHGGEKNFKCPECPKTYFSPKSLRTHVQQIHSEVKTTYTCEICGAILRTMAGFINHKKAHKKLYKCSVCLRLFGLASSLKSHMLTHTGEKPFPCDICGRAFRRLAELQPHRRIHTGEKPFSCEFCERRFADKGNMRKHIKTHKKLSSA